MIPDFLFEPMHKISEKIATGEVSSEEVTEAALAQVDDFGDILNPFITRTIDIARQMARAADDELRSGHYRGPLHGIPVVLKDLFETRGIRTTAGSKTRENVVPDRDSTVAQLLRDAGAVFIGKTGMPEFAVTGTSINPTFGHVRNPWNPEVDTAGSSSGTGAAVAAGMAWCGPGSDTAGSIRMPASACGLVGLKPTYGRISLRGVLPLNAALDHVGPMARTVRDAAILLEVLSGYDPEDPCSRDGPINDCLGELEVGITGVRIAALRHSGVHVDADIDHAFRSGTQTLERAGAIIDEIEIPDLRSIARPLFSVGILTHYSHLLEADVTNLAPYFIDTLRNARSHSQVDVMVACREVNNGLHQLDRRMRPYDLAVSPTLAVHPPQAGHLTRGELLQLTAVWNLNGWPALSIPVALSPENVPIGFQIIGRPWTEPLLFRAARVIESHHALNFPPVWLDGEMRGRKVTV